VKWQAKRPLAKPASTSINFAKGFDTMDASKVHSKERYMNNKDLEDHRMRQTCTAVLVNVPSDSKRLQVAFMDEIWHTILREHSRLKCTHLVPDIVMCFSNVFISSFSTFGSIGLIESCSQPCLPCVHAQSVLLRQEV